MWKIYTSSSMLPNMDLEHIFAREVRSVNASPALKMCVCLCLK